MEITEVRIKLSNRPGNRVKAFATITLDNSFVVRDMRIIEGRNGMFVAMPSRPLKDPCPKCGFRNPVRGKFCAGCGSELTVAVNAEMDDKNLHRDVAHPITQEMREYIHNKIIEAYKLELEKGPSESAPIPSGPAPEEGKTPKVARSRFGRRRAKPEAEAKPEAGKEETKEGISE